MSLTGFAACCHKLVASGLFGFAGGLCPALSPIQYSQTGKVRGKVFVWCGQRPSREQGRDLNSGSRFHSGGVMSYREVDLLVVVGRKIFLDSIPVRVILGT